MAERRAAGKALRDEITRESHGEWSRRPGFPNPVEIVMETNQERQAHLVPLRMARMIASPFGFYRGAVAVMGARSCHDSFHWN